jgi:hypothetical protein
MDGDRRPTPGLRHLSSSSTTASIVNARLWRFCGACAAADTDAHGGNRLSRRPVSLFAVELPAGLQQKVLMPQMARRGAT